MSYEAFINVKQALLLEKQAQLEALVTKHGRQASTRRELVWIKFALKRIQEEQYGLCTNCGGPISDELLDMIPEIPFCSICHRNIEAQS